MKVRATPITFVAFCERVLALKLTNAQRVLATVCIDNVAPKDLKARDRKLARELFGDIDEVPKAARRVQAWSLGRGSGKTTLCAALMIYVALTASLDRVGPGMTPAAVALAPRTSTARLVVNVARQLVRNVPALEAMVARGEDTKNGFALIREGRRVFIGAFAGSRGGVTTRGFDILILIFDEAELFQSDSGYVVTDRDCYASCMPRLMLGEQHKALLISTPWPVATLMGELFEKNFGAPKSALAARASTITMRDHDADLAAFIEQERERNPEDAEREFFVSRDAVGTQDFYPGDLIASCEEDDLMFGAPIPADEDRFAGGDIGLTRDHSTLIVSSRNHHGIIRLRELVELKPKKNEPLKLSGVIGAFAKTMKACGVTNLVVDQHVREPAKEWASEHGITIEDAPAGSEGIFETFETARRLMKEGRLRWAKHPRLGAQLRSVTVSPLPAGGYRVKLPRRIGQGHSDLVSAFVLAAHAANEGDNAPQIFMDQIASNGVGPAFDDRPIGGVIAETRLTSGWRHRPLAKADEPQRARDDELADAMEQANKLAADSPFESRRIG